jgi:hypothetical protein
MRTIIDITDEQVKALDEISKIEETSRTALIRQAIDRMLAEDARKGEAASLAFGLWSGRKERPAPKVAPRPQELVSSIEDSFVVTPPVSEVVVEQVVTEAEVPSSAPAAEPVVPNPQPTPVREASITTVDPLAAFFAGVKP